MKHSVEKIAALLLAAVLLFTLPACSSENSQDSTVKPAAKTDTATELRTEAETGAPETEPATESAAATEMETETDAPETETESGELTGAFIGRWICDLDITSIAYEMVEDVLGMSANTGTMLSMSVSLTLNADGSAEFVVDDEFGDDLDAFLAGQREPLIAMVLDGRSPDAFERENGRSAEAYVASALFEIDSDEIAAAVNPGNLFFREKDGVLYFSKTPGGLSENDGLVYAIEYDVSVAMVVSEIVNDTGLFAGIRDNATLPMTFFRQ